MNNESITMEIMTGYRAQPQPEEPVTASQLTVIGIVTVVSIGLALLGWELGMSLQAAGLV